MPTLSVCMQETQAAMLWVGHSTEAQGFVNMFRVFCKADILPGLHCMFLLWTNLQRASLSNGMTYY